MKNRKMNPAALAAALIGAVALFGAAGCDDGSSPKLCICPNGTFHDEGTPMPCCDGDNCECKVAYNVSLGGKQIRVEDTTGLANKAEIEESLEWINDNMALGDGIIYFKAMNTNPVMVIENSHNVRVDGNKFFIGIDAINVNINDAILDAITHIYSDGAPKMAKLSNKEINELGIRFDAVKNIIYVENARVSVTKFA